MTRADEPHVLDRPVAASLAGHHAKFAQRHGQAVRYQADVAIFAALDDPEDPTAWADAVHLFDPEVPLVVPGATQCPDDWEMLRMLNVVQMEGSGVTPEPDPEAVPLGPDDVPEVLDLIARTDPGPFRRRTIDLGTYLGIRHEGALIAMAGERMHQPGWTEISAVCTDPAYRGQGLAARLLRAVAAEITTRGETPFLHVAAANENAIRLYEKLGFTLRRTMPFAILGHRGSVG
jgi:ribosomal protein S18 acetylase RimI-like enzyme